jgi:hypothetical protein
VPDYEIFLHFKNINNLYASRVHRCRNLKVYHTHGKLR